MAMQMVRYLDNVSYRDTNNQDTFVPGKCCIMDLNQYNVKQCVSKRELN